MSDVAHRRPRFETGNHVIVREGCTLGDAISIWNNSVIDYDDEPAEGVKVHSNCYVAQYTRVVDDEQGRRCPRPQAWRPSQQEHDQP